MIYRSGLVTLLAVSALLQGCHGKQGSEEGTPASGASEVMADGLTKTAQKPKPPEPQAEEAPLGWYQLSSTTAAMGSRFLKKCVPIDGDTILQVMRENASDPGCKVSERRSPTGRVQYISMFCTYTNTEYFRGEDTCRNELERTTLRPEDYK